MSSNLFSPFRHVAFKQVDSVCVKINKIRNQLNKVEVVYYYVHLLMHSRFVIRPALWILVVALALICAKIK